MWSFSTVNPLGYLDTHACVRVLGCVCVCMCVVHAHTHVCVAFWGPLVVTVSDNLRFRRIPATSLGQVLLLSVLNNPLESRQVAQGGRVCWLGVCLAPGNRKSHVNSLGRGLFTTSQGKAGV